MNFKQNTIHLRTITKKQKLSIPKQILKTIFLSCLFFLSLSATQNLRAQPNTPAGFVANPASGEGEVFLACGPNNVGGAGTIVYKLFYSPTASAPADPLTATEYVFGSTPGDGNGVNAFGFTMTGLTPGTEYTFWLYQYDTATMEYSAPAAATQTSGAAGGPPDTPAGLVANPSTGSGQIFLACGPNDVGANDIVYKLFYSPTASAPADPLTATEYIFGSTPGDGNGVNPFGFTMTGLTPDTEYTFWLYQYDTGTMLYSVTPGTASQTSSNEALPVTWYEPLRATLTENKLVKITWSVSEQVNNEKFIIEHSKNGRDFSAIDNITGGGTINEVQEYHFTHTEPVAGTNYYRINQVDYDGKSDKSNIATVWYSAEQEVSIYPNPASSSVTVRSTQATNLQIKNLYGRLVKTMFLSEGENALLLDDLSNGVYIFEFENGQVETFVKQ